MNNATQNTANDTVNLARRTALFSSAGAAAAAAPALLNRAVRRARLTASLAVF